MSGPLLSLLLLALTIVLLIWLFWPERGSYWRWRRSRQLTKRVLLEDALKHLHRYHRYDRLPTVDSLAGALNVGSNEAVQILSELEARELVEIDGESFQLTSEGHEYALQVIRAHRLWERYLADKTGYSQSDWHDRADLAEHTLSSAEADSLAAELGNPTHDPHGDPIPTGTGRMVLHGGSPLTTMPLDTPVNIVHLEDEPEAIYAQLAAEGLELGMELRLLEISPKRVRFQANGSEHILAPIVAANISTIPIKDSVITRTTRRQKLSSLAAGESGQVSDIARSCRGSERRRFLDLGILPGTLITAEFISPSGDPTAYRIREALIALRHEQAEHIFIRRRNKDE
jgi:DtxR family Mn-dependent transcriptional regulator